MLKNKLDYKLVNLVLIVLVVFLVYQTGALWSGLLNLVLTICLPFLFAFALAYAIYPFLTYMIDKKVPKGLGIALIILLLFGLISMVIYLVSTIMWDQLSLLFTNIITFFGSLETENYDINLIGLETDLTKYFTSILTNLSNYVSDGAINLVNTSIDIISKLFIIFAAFVYFLIDMDKIRNETKKILKKLNKTIYQLVYNIDLEMKKYFISFIKIMIITFFEYNLGFIIVGHPNFLLLGILASISSIIPYFGGIIVNVIAGICAFVIGKSLFIKTMILIFILSMIDSYLIGPIVYGKSNKIHPLVSIFAVFAGGILFGIMGIIISMPLCIIILTIYRFFKDDIYDKIKKK